MCHAWKQVCLTPRLFPVPLPKSFFRKYLKQSYQLQNRHNCLFYVGSNRHKFLFYKKPDS